MKNFKPFVLGCIAGCGVMFVALQYHVVQSHDGLQFVPRAPKSTLGLAYADVRQWQAEQWTDFPELARALVAHGSSDLIAESVANDITDSLNPDAGTIGQLRSLLNDQMSSDFDAPLFESEDTDDRLIPFPNEARNSPPEESFTYRTNKTRSHNDVADNSRSRLSGANSDFDSGFAGFEDMPDQDTGRRSQNNTFNEADSSWRFDSQSDTSPDSKAAARVRDTTILEDLLFSEEDESDDISESIPSLEESRFESMTRALDSRASQALDRASNGFSDRSSGSYGTNNEAINGYVRDRIRSEYSKPGSYQNSMRDPVPHAVQALRDGFDPFLD